jgi:hypothetical protein
MRLIVARASAFADQQAKAPEDHSWAYPGAAMMDRAGEPASSPQPQTTAPSGQDKPQPAAPPQH